MLPRPLLYTYRRCPYAMRARMALLQARIAFDAYEIVLRHKPPELLASSPKGTVPVLILPDGTVIEQSLAIMRWACETSTQAHDAQGWWARSQTSDNLALMALNDGDFKHHLDRYKYPEKFETGDRDLNLKKHRDHALHSFLAPLEQRLTAQPCLGGTQPCAADVAIFPFVRQFRAVDEAWFDAQDVRATQLWLQRWLTSKLFDVSMKKLPVNERVSF